MRTPLRLFLAAATTASLATAAVAQALPPPTPEQVAQLAAIARQNITQALMSDGTPVPAETPAELARPIIPQALVRQTIARGYLTGEMEACGMEWRDASFLPYMAAVRASRRYSGKQLAYIGMLHGIGQGTAASAVAEATSTCPKAHRDRLEAAVRKAPILTP